VAILGFVLEVPVPVLMYRVATGWVHLFGVKCKECYMHENTTNNTLCTVVYIVYCICVRKVTSCLSAGMAAHKFKISNIIVYNTALPTLAEIRVRLIRATSTALGITE
jgi:hypothetical protein